MGRGVLAECVSCCQIKDSGPSLAGVSGEPGTGAVRRQSEMKTVKDKH